MDKAQLIEAKKALRKEIRRLKKEVSLEKKISRSKAILEQVENDSIFQNAKTILLYWSMDDEVYTQSFVKKWYKEKRILLPCVDGDFLRLRQFKGMDTMQAGEQFGIGEPTGEEFLDYDQINLIIVPGMAFDKENNRMGRGRGFYDRLLSSTPKAYKMGLAFNFQMFDSIPVEPFDIKMDRVVSEP